MIGKENINLMHDENIHTSVSSTERPLDSHWEKKQIFGLKKDGDFFSVITVNPKNCTYFFHQILSNILRILVTFGDCFVD